MQEDRHYILRHVHSLLIAVWGWCFVYILFPVIVMAQECEPGKLCNPLSVNSLREFFATVFQIIVAVGLPFIGFFIIYAGFRFVLAQGNETELTKAKNNFKWLIVGAVLILGAWAILELLSGTFAEIRR